MSKRRSGLSLSFKMWLGFAFYSILAIVMLAFVFIYIFSSARDSEMFSSVEKAQSLLLNRGLTGENMMSDNILSAITVDHIGIVNRAVEVMTFSGIRGELSTVIVDKVSSSFSEQKDGKQKYKAKLGSVYLYYLINKTGDDGIISFRIDDANNSFYRIIYYTVPILLVTAIILSFIYAIIYSRSMTKNLNKLSKSVELLADGNLVESVIINKRDEIGRLSRDIDDMRIKLVKKDLLRQSEIQYISHELKTPVMTIMSYVQAIKDNIYPKGNIEDSLKVLDGQAERLKNIINKLITISRLDYLDAKKSPSENLNLADIIENVCSETFIRKEIDLDLKLDSLFVKTDSEKVFVLCENLIENALRHAKNNVAISLSKNKDGIAELEIINDGELIDTALLPELFEAYKKGKGGISGLGLSIVKRIADSYGWIVSAENSERGAKFTVLFVENKYLLI